MADIRLTYRPGIDRELTDTTLRGAWAFSQNVRWREGSAEKVRGWQRQSDTALTGICRALHWWTDLSRVSWLACGTTSKLELLLNGVIYDITPAGLPPGQESSGAVPFSLRVWDLDNFGQMLIGVPSGNGLYSWTPPNTATPASLITQAPPHNQGGFVTMPQRIILLYGSSPDMGTLDPLLVRWCDADDPTDWTPTTTNFAGSFRLSRGSRIVGGVQSPLGAFLFTDIDVWSTQFEGFPLVFGFFQIGSNCGLISQKAVTVVGSVPYWMSDHGFFRMAGSGVEQIPCTVWDDVFLDIDQNNLDKCVAGTDYHFSEVIFEFPSQSGGTGEIDSFAKYNIAENLWDVGKHSQMARTAWTDQNRPGSPLTVDLAGLIQQQNVGRDADGKPLLASIRSGFNDLADGTDMIYIDRYMPDFRWEGSEPSIQLTIFFRDYPGGQIRQRGPFTVTPQTTYIKIDARGREWSEQIDVITADTWFRRGTPRARIAPDGRL